MFHPIPKIFMILSISILTGVSVQASDLKAPSGTYVNDVGHTSLLWKINHLGLSNYTARINDPRITLNFNADDVTQSSVSAIIDPKKVDTGFSGNEDFDKKISDSDFLFHSQKFPTIEFKSTKITKTGEMTADIEGDLTFLGKTGPVLLKATYMGSTDTHPFVKVPAIGFHAITSFDRTQWGLGFLSGKGLGDIVEIEIQTEFLKNN